MKHRSIRLTAAMVLICILIGSICCAFASEKPLKWWQQTIAYEIYVKSFKDSDGDGTGDLQGIISELDYLHDLGVGVIWLTPCYVSPQADNGYDIADYRNIDPAYGTMADMEALIAQAGQRGIRIVMDLVFNHTSDQNPWFLDSRSGRDAAKSDWYIWMDPKADGSAPNNWRSIFGGSAWTYDETRGQYYLHTFLPEQPDLNWANPEVRRALADVAAFWIGKGVGGFRMDAITYIKKPAGFPDGEPDAADGTAGIHKMTANTDGILDYLHEFRAAVEEGEDIFTVGETNGITTEDLPLWVGENGVFDMVFEFGHVLIDLPDEMNWCRTREWQLTELKAIFAASQQKADEAGGWVGLFLENHDQPRSISHFLPEDADRIAGGKALATLLLTMRGTPFIMEGEELGLINVAWDSIDRYNDVSTINHYSFAIGEGYTPEEALAGVHRFARDSARTPMQWDDTVHAGFTSGTPWLPVSDDYATVNAAAERQNPDSVLNWYIHLAALRSRYPVLTEGTWTELFHEDERIFAYTRETEDAKAVVLINLSTEPAEYDPACLEGAELIADSAGSDTRGLLQPLEAAVYLLPVTSQPSVF